MSSTDSTPKDHPQLHNHDADHEAKLTHDAAAAALGDGSNPTPAFGATREQVQAGLEAMQATFLRWARADQSQADAIRETWRLFRLEGQPVELAAFDCGEIDTGGRPSIRGQAVRYVDDVDQAIDAALVELGDRGKYVVPARLLRGIETRYDVGRWSRANKVAGEADVLHSRALVIDADPQRVGSTSSTAAEWATAVGVAGHVRSLLLSAGCSENALAIGHSGNGAHVPVLLDIDWSEQAKDLRTRCLRALGVLCDYTTGTTCSVLIDQAMSDGARYVPLYGSLKRKGGAGHAERPHRRTQIEGPEVVEPLDLDEFRSVVEGLEGMCSAEGVAAWEAACEQRKAKKSKTSTGKTPTKSTNTSKTARTDDDIFARANEQPIKEVMERLGVDRVCPGCGEPEGKDNHKVPGANTWKCFRDNNCPGNPLHPQRKKSWSPVDTVAMARSVTPLEAAKAICQEFGIEVPQRKKSNHRRAPNKAELLEVAGITVEEGESTAEPAREIPARAATPVSQPANACNVVNLQLVRQEQSKPRPLTDLGNAERLVEQHGDDIGYCTPWGKWLVWDGARWAIDSSQAVERLAHRTVRSIYVEASNEGDDAKRAARAAHAVKSESAARIAAMITLAQAMVPIEPQQLDQHPWLLNVANGTIELQTGLLREHRRDDWLTKQAPVVYDPVATAPTWEAFLKQVQPDDQVRAYLRRRWGYALTGAIREHSIDFDIGVGANGKSTAANTIGNLLGDYAVQVPISLLAEKKPGSHPTDSATLFGVRYAVASEPAEGMRLDSALVKTLTGGDPITTRRMREDYWTYEPTHHLSVPTNHRIVIRDTSDGIWRRVKLVEWPVVVPAAEQDGDLPNKLLAEASGILNALVEGCLEWQRIGLAPPESVEVATQQYREESDLLGAFCADCLVLDAKAELGGEALYTLYVGWAERQGHKAMAKNTLTTRLNARRFGQSGRDETNRATRRGVRARLPGDVDTKAAVAHLDQAFPPDSEAPCSGSPEVLRKQSSTREATPEHRSTPDQVSFSPPRISSMRELSGDLLRNAPVLQNSGDDAVADAGLSGESEQGSSGIVVTEHEPEPEPSPSMPTRPPPGIFAGRATYARLGRDGLCVEVELTTGATVLDFRVLDDLARLARICREYGFDLPGDEWIPVNGRPVRVVVGTAVAGFPGGVRVTTFQRLVA